MAREKAKTGREESVEFGEEKRATKHYIKHYIEGTNNSSDENKCFCLVCVELSSCVVCVFKLPKGDLVSVCEMLFFSFSFMFSKGVELSFRHKIKNKYMFTFNYVFLYDS